LNSSFHSNITRNNGNIIPRLTEIDESTQISNLINKVEDESDSTVCFNDSGFKNSTGLLSDKLGVTNSPTDLNDYRIVDTNENRIVNEYCDNEENNIKNCDICGYIFPTDLDTFGYEQHMSSHYGPSCPLCFLTFRKGYPQIDFENHVNSHFTN